MPGNVNLLIECLARGFLCFSSRSSLTRNPQPTCIFTLLIFRESKQCNENLH